jgi:hypothetical protein
MMDTTNVTSCPASGGLSKLGMIPGGGLTALVRVGSGAPELLLLLVVAATAAAILMTLIIHGGRRASGLGAYARRDHSPISDAPASKRESRRANLDGIEGVYRVATSKSEERTRCRDSRVFEQAASS